MENIAEGRVDVVEGDADEAGFEAIGFFGGIAGGAGLLEEAMLGAEPVALAGDEAGENGDRTAEAAAEEVAGEAGLREVGVARVAFGGGGAKLGFFGPEVSSRSFFGDVELNLKFGDAGLGSLTGHGFALGKFATDGGEGGGEIAARVLNFSETRVDGDTEVAGFDGVGVGAGFLGVSEGFVEAVEVEENLGAGEEGLGEFDLAAERAALGEDVVEGGEGFVGFTVGEFEQAEACFKIGDLGAVAFGAFDGEGSFEEGADGGAVAAFFFEAGEIGGIPADGAFVAVCIGEGEGCAPVGEGLVEVVEFR